MRLLLTILLITETDMVWVVLFGSILATTKFMNWICAVLHDAAGCSDKWADLDIICEICLRNCNVKESRKVEKVYDPYQSAKDRLNKIKQK